MPSKSTKNLASTYASEGTEPHLAQPRTSNTTRQAAGASAVNRIAGAPSHLLVSPLPEDEHKTAQIRGTAFVKGQDDTSDISPTDVSQGQLGDCYFLSAVGALAHANPEAIRRLIHDNHDGTYNVTLYATDGFFKPKTAHTLRVDARFPVDTQGQPAYAAGREVAPNGDLELWVMLLEKAYATFMGSYHAIEGGMHLSNFEQKGNKATAGLEMVQAGSAHAYWCAFYSNATTEKRIEAALREHRPVTASSYAFHIMPSAKALAKSKDVVAGHAYTVGYCAGGRIKLQNPWGFKHLDLSIEEFTTLFECYGIGSPAV